VGQSSEMSRATRTLETTKNIKKLLPSFFTPEKKEETEDKKHLAWCMHGVPPELLAAFELPWKWPENYGTLCAARLVASDFIDLAEAEGFSNELCSYLLNSIGYCVRCRELGTVPPESPVEEGLGDPSMMLGSGLTCDPRYKWFQTLATRYVEKPVFSSDPLSPPPGIDVHDSRVEAHYLEHLRRDLQAQINFLEEQLGQEMDRKKLGEIMHHSHQAEKYWYEALELCKNRPAPFGATDYFTAIIPQLYMMGAPEASHFYQELYHEAKTRVENNIGVVKKEKFRFIFFGIPPWFNLGYFNYLEEQGAVVTNFATYYVGKPVETDLKDPVEALVQRTWKKAVWYHGQGTEVMPEICNPGIASCYVGRKLLDQWIEEFSLDGAIFHRTKSCRALSVGQLFYRNYLSEKNVPTLVFESDMADPRTWSDARIKNLTETFLETVETNKK